MGRRRRKKIRKTRPRTSPIYKYYFNCPQCGQLTLSVTLKRVVVGTGEVKYVARAVCGNCGLSCKLEVPPNTEKIDVYNMISDYVYEERVEECVDAGGDGEVEGGEAEQPPAEHEERER